MTRKRKIAILAGSAALLLAMALGALSWYTRTAHFQSWLQRSIQARVQSATGWRCEIGSLHVEPWRGSFAVERLVLAPASGAERLRVELGRGAGRLRFSSILPFKISLAELVLQRPVFRIALGTGGGGWNPEPFLRGIRRSFDFTAGSLIVDQGQVDLGDRRVPIDLSITDLVCRIDPRPKAGHYAIHLEHEDGSVAWPGRRLDFGLSADLRITLDGLAVESARVKHRRSTVTASGGVRDWRAPGLALALGGRAETGDLSIVDPILADLEGPAGLSGTLNWDRDGLRARLDWEMKEGVFRGRPLVGMTGRVEIEPDKVAVRDVKGRLAGGMIAGEVDLSRKPGVRHRARLRIADLAISDGGKVTGIPEMLWHNRVSGDLTIDWRGGPKNLDLSARLTMAGPPEGGGETHLGLEGPIAFRFHRGAWLLDEVELRSRETELIVRQVGESRCDARLRTTRIAEVLAPFREVVPGLRAFLDEYPDWPSLSGECRLEGVFQFAPVEKLSFEGRIALERGRWRQWSADKAASDVSWNGEDFRFRNLAMDKGEASIRGQLDLLQEAGAGAGTEVRFSGNVARLPVDLIREYLPEDVRRADGLLTGQVRLRSLRSEFEADGDLTLNPASFGEERFDLLRGRFSLAAGRLQLASFEAARGEARITLKGLLDLPERRMDLAGRLKTLPLRSIQAVRDRDLDFDGRLSVDGKLSGTFDLPRFSGTLQADGLRYADWNLGAGTGNVRLADKVLEADGSVRSELGGFRFEARLSTEPGFAGKALLDLSDWNVQRIAGESAPPLLSDLSTALQGRVEIEGRFGEPATLRYRGELDGVRLKLHGHELRNGGRVRFSAAGGRLRVEEARLVGQGTEVALGGEVPLDRGPGLDLRLKGALNLQVLQPAGGKTRFTGGTGLDVRASGSVASPEIIGQAQLDNCRIEHEDLPFSLSAIRGGVVFSRNLVRFDRVQGTLGTGSFQLGGALEHQNAQVRSMNLQISARHARLPYPRDFRSTVDADLSLRGGVDAQVLSGEVRVVRSEYLKEFDLLEQITARSGGYGGAPAVDAALAGLRFNISILSDNGLRIDNELARIQGDARLVLRGTPAVPSLSGRVEATQGSIFFRGNRFDILRGTADFADRSRMVPSLDVRAEAEVRSYRLVLDVTGDLDRPSVNLTSDPPLSTVEILTLLTTGKAAAGADSSRRQAEVTGLSAASILSESLTGVVGKRVQRLFGLETFRVDPFLAGAENDPTARVTISQRISSDLAVTFSRNLTTQEEQVVVVEYEVTRGFSIIATRDENGVFGIDFRFRKRFR